MGIATVGYSTLHTESLVATDIAVKTSPAMLFGLSMGNVDTAIDHWVHFYNALIADVTVGTTAPLISILVPRLDSVNIEWSRGIIFSTALTWAATTTVGGSTAPTAGDMAGAVLFV